MGAPPVSISDPTGKQKKRVTSPRDSVKRFFRRNSKSALSATTEHTNDNVLGKKDHLSSSIHSESDIKREKRGLLGNILPKQKSKSGLNAGTLLAENKGLSTIVLHETSSYDNQRLSAPNAINSIQIHRAEASPLGPCSPKRDSLFQWQDEMEKRDKREQLQRKQLIKERDGFCRRVYAYDGQVITVEGKPAYELGNYLGGGVAGVVYEGHRLRPVEDYPVRLGRHDSLLSLGPAADALVFDVRQHQHSNPPVEGISIQSMLCLTAEPDAVVESKMEDPSTINNDDRVSSILSEGDRSQRTFRREQTEEIALEATASKDQQVIIDTIDAPSRSKHYANAVAMNAEAEFPSDASFTNFGLMDETVAVKVLNPVSFRTLSIEVTNTAVVARAGETLPMDIFRGEQPMEEKHVWWLVNPNSRNLRTLQRYSADSNNNISGPTTRRVEVDRGSAEKGLRISLIAAYKDPSDGMLKELPLTRCIEIWGHVSFGATDAEFNQIMMAIDRINQGQPPPPIPAFATVPDDVFSDGTAPGRVATGGTNESSISGGSASLEDLNISKPMSAKRTGIYRAASTGRKTVFCHELKAYIALPAVPSKYLKWLRQRRAATKEIRNMMLIGRHRNVVHLFEVLEYIQETKSTMFLILELVRGGELFDLISSNAARISSTDKIPTGFTESETVMRKFFRELASGIFYCHGNGIAHRDLKPENLLVHNSRTGDCTLKIADFGLSAAFGPNSQSQTDNDTVVESLAPGGGGGSGSLRYQSDISLLSSPPPVSTTASPIMERVDKFLHAGGSALAFLTCGAVEDLINCNPRTEDVDAAPVTLKRMTSVVGSPHYVAPEIISQNETKRGSKNNNTPSEAGYDGTKADVWSAGVILYAMLFRSLPFGEDLLRCPRYQSFKKWYDEVKTVPNCRRSDLNAPLDPVITEVDERDFLGPHWFFPSHSSPESRDLIVYMLNPDPDCRPTIQLVLKHPWLLKQ